MFGAATGDDPLYEAVSAGQRYPGLEHWLPLFHEHLETLFDYMPGVAISFDHLADEAVRRRLDADRRALRSARQRAGSAQASGRRAYKPVPPKLMYLDGRVGPRLTGARREAHDAVRGRGRT